MFTLRAYKEYETIFVLSASPVLYIIQLLFLITKFPLEWGELSVMVFIL